MSDADKPAVEESGYPKLCKCGTPLQDGWCENCSARRQRMLVRLLLVFLPLGGFGACALSVSGRVPYQIATIGALVFVISPVVGLAYAIFAYLQNRRHRR